MHRRHAALHAHLAGGQKDGRGRVPGPVSYTHLAIVDDGKLKTPHVVKEILNADGTVKQSIETEVKRQVISADTSAYMREAMEKVVSQGTGQNAYVAGYRIGGKTARCV